MASTVIRVENLSKQYRLGEVSTGSIAHDINRLWYKMRGKEDPYLKVGQENDRTKKGIGEYVWALKDINFDVTQGEILGIIGRNGAGKSTLLKILSRTTTPTTGSVKLKGRVASLLEVGTGFHPELSGRDNIFLNGAILGMTKVEIRKKFDEIVDFAGIERYIDTPVKRYSSGMYVRLAFGVAAHLEPEILIVDEVLAVGDAEFQKKCLGKMNDVSQKDGRTVIFVSHNLTAIQSLCKSVLFVEKGRISAHGNTQETIDLYLGKVITNALEKEWHDVNTAPGNDIVRAKSFKAIPMANDSFKKITIETPIKLVFEFTNLLSDLLFNLSIHIYNSSGEIIFAVASPNFRAAKGDIEVSTQIPANLLNDGGYYISVMIVKDAKSILFIEESINFEVSEPEREIGWLGKWPGYVRPIFNWDISTSQI